MPFVAWAGIAVLVVLALIVATGASRLRTLSRRVGSFPCSARPAGNPQAAWSLGIAHYAVGRIEWWRCWSLSPRPTRTWLREELSITGRVPLDQAGQPDEYLVRCRYDGTDFELTMSSGAYAGLASWLEAAPPGRRDLVV
ncbi:DUF2550 domain-containing protein [Isoptericola variabilis]|uniref:Secreted/membrane protein n=1 Tax=Isoptericola variabilis (strain 225) TaxID=743718 RepID=F6FR67_ISOV2|nr:DUF2550 domain-containing protein [Isoptericola variabilis]AEG45017.1 Protein of unknown function DUF2550 [Isoptericola variabilis 225]TWH26143.1 uncharacterized protein DUF2550 [Isoptericola variabilis J7]